MAHAHPDLLAQIEVLDARIAAEPDDPEWRIRRGDLYRRHADFNAAAADFHAARLLAPHDPELDFYQGRLALEAGEPGEAGRYLEQYLRVNPRHAGAWRLRAKAFEKLGEHSEAAAAFGRAVALGDSPSPALFREWVMALLTAGEPTAALGAVDQGLERLGPEVTLLGLGTDIALAGGDAPRARRYLDRLPTGLERHPPWRERILEAACIGKRPECDSGAAGRLAVPLDSSTQL